MISYFIPDSGTWNEFWGILFAFVTTIVFTAVFKKYLPKDAGREFAHDGKLSAGKPRGAGMIFVLCFVVSALLFAPLSVENLIFLLLVVICMLTGFFDDASEKPWNEYKKGALDLCVAVATALTVLHYDGNTIRLALFQVDVTIPVVLFVILAIILVWTSVNVTNCSDGVDGLSGTLSVVTLLSIYAVDVAVGQGGLTTSMILFLVACIVAYLWFNATPSVLMMGDAGSRAIGLFIAIAILKSRSPFLYIPLALVLILDGGLGLLKVSLLRFLKIHILKNVRTPLHDHVRKVWGWSNTQTVFRFTIIQLVLCVAVVYLVKLGG